jgi:predicted glycosyltransferase
MIVVTHLLGAGHLTRSAALARAFARAGHEVALVSGGMPAPLVALDGVRLIQLPPVRTIGTDFRTLLDPAGTPVDAAYRARRRSGLLDALAEIRPDVLVTELFPFGRRGLADEFLPLLEAAGTVSPRPLIACSVRDILVPPGKPARIAEAHERLACFYDLVLVHGDSDLVPLEASWPVNDAARGLLRYTGYVDEGASPAAGSEREGIVVSGGSSSASLPLYRSALAAAGLLPEEPWRILVGHGVPEDAFTSLREASPLHVTVERARPDFRTFLGRAAASVSQCGYNTAVDVLRVGVPAVFVPFEAGQETEQRQRADCLAAAGLAQVLPEAELSPERLAAALRTAIGRRPRPNNVSLDGAVRSVAVVEAALGRRAASERPGSWATLDDALARLADSPHRLSFWWRDDDAVAATLPFERLLALANRFGIPLGIAAVPATAQPSLAERLTAESQVALLVHGLSHVNHAPPGEKKAEFGRHRPSELLKRDAGLALDEAHARLGARLLPVFVPPWNRIDRDLVSVLPGLGYRGLSTFNDRANRSPTAGLIQINTHLDPIDWHGTRGALPLEILAERLGRRIKARIEGIADRDEPIGLLTHHLVHDEEVWHVCEILLERLSRSGLFHYPFAAEVFFDPAEPVAIEL